MEKAKQSPTEMKALAKAKGLEVKTSEKFNRLQNFVPGLGEMPDLVAMPSRIRALYSRPKPLRKRAHFRDRVGAPGHQA